MASLQLYHSHIIHTHKWWRDSHYHQSSILLTAAATQQGDTVLPGKMTPSPFNNAACRYGPTSYVPIEWELSLKIWINTTWFLPMGHSRWISTHSHLDFEECAFNLSSQYIWNWKENSIICKTRRGCQVLAFLSQDIWATVCPVWVHVCTYICVKI